MVERATIVIRCSSWEMERLFEVIDTAKDRAGVFVPAPLLAELGRGKTELARWQKEVDRRRAAGELVLLDR